MPKVSVIEIDNIHSPGTASSLNTNFTRVQTAIEDTLSRSGATPNYMDSDLDMNGYNIINVGNSEVPGTSGSGSDYGLTFDGTTDQTDALNTVFETYKYVKLVPATDATGALRIDGTIDVPDGCILDISAIDIDLGTYGRIYPQGKISELPAAGTANIRLAQAAEAGDTTIYLNLVEASNGDLLDTSELLIFRGENDSSGVAITKEEKRISSVTVTGSLTRTVVLTAGLENDYELEYPDSAHTPEGGGPDRTLITVAVGSLLTGNVSRYDRTVTVLDGSLFTVNDMVMLRSDALVIPTDSSSIPFGEEPNIIESISTNTITLARPISRAFLTADGAGLYKVDSRQVTIIGGRGTIRAVQAGPSDRRIDFFGGQFLRNSYFKDIRVDSGGQTYDKEGAGIGIRRSVNTIIENPSISSRANTGSGDGNGIFVAYSTGTLVLSPLVYMCRHGVLFQGGAYNVAHDGYSSGCYTNGFDFHGGGEVFSGFIDCMAVAGNTNAPDSTEQGGMTVGNTRWRGGVYDCFVSGFKAIGFDFGIVVRAPTDYLSIVDSKISECTTGIKIAIDDRAGTFDIDTIILQANVFTNCDTDIDDDTVEAPAWSSASTVDSATAIRPRYRINESKLYSTSAGGTTGATPPTHSSGTQSDDNLDWTYVAASITRITNVTDRDSVVTTVVDDDTFATASATVPPSSESTKVYVDTSLANRTVNVTRSSESAETDDFVLDSTNARMQAGTAGVKADFAVRVDASSGPIDITVDPDDITEDMEWTIIVIDATNTVTLKRPEVTFDLLGDTTDTDETVTMASTANIEVGFGVSGDGVPGSTTVDSIVPNTSIEMTAAATATDTGVTLTFDAGQQGQIDGEELDVELGPGVIEVKVVTLPSLGANLLTRGDTKQGVGAYNTETESGNFTLGYEHIGKLVVITAASGTVTITVPSKDNITPVPKDWRPTLLYLQGDSTATATVTSGTGSPTFDRPDGQGLVLLPGVITPLTALDESVTGFDYHIQGTTPT